MKLTLRDMILAALFAALMVVGAYLRIPTPFGIEITFQLFFAVFAGLLLKPMAALSSQLVYIALGLIGLPVFAGGGGISYVFRLSFGYIIGFAVTAFTVSLLVNFFKKTTFGPLLTYATLGFIMTYLIGNLYFWFIMNNVNGGDMSLFTVFKTMAGFAVKDYILIIVAVLASIKVIPVIKRVNPVTV